MTLLLTYIDSFQVKADINGSYVVLGAYGGVGSTLCRRLANKGANLLLAGKDETRLATLAAELGTQTFPVDATNLGQVVSCMKQASSCTVKSLA